jgi:Flp pilus assembly protein TadD
MIVRKRWAEAHAALSQVDLRLFPAHSRAVVLNNLAYVTARNGDPEKALEIISQAFAEADKAAGAKMVQALPSLRGTHGIALTLAGRHEEALPLLQLGAHEGTDRSRNERLYWLGKVYRMLGRDDDARVAFAMAIELGGPCTEEAKTALADGTPFRG